MSDDAYELIDIGDGARLERFDGRVVDRPAAAALAPRRFPDAWHGADLRFDRDHGWTSGPDGADDWRLDIDGVVLELRPTDAGQVGFFPEHASMLPWLQRQVSEAADPDADLPAVLDLFAYTGLTTIALAAVGAAVTHVDASRPTVTWARRNAVHSGLADRPIRWIVDDASRFVAREIRRGRRYAGIVLDPPTYGHGPNREPWRLEDDLDDLLAATRRLLEPDGFALLTAHTPGLGPDELERALATGLGRPTASIETGELAVRTADGRVLDLGAFARIPRAAS